MSAIVDTVLQTGKEISLEKGAFLTVDLPTDEAVVIRILRGRAWVTAERDPEDYVCIGGESVWIRTAGRVVVEALEFSSMVLDRNP